MDDTQKRVLDFMNEYPMLFNAIFGIDDVMGITLVLPGQHPVFVGREDQNERRV